MLDFNEPSNVTGNCNDVTAQFNILMNICFATLDSIPMMRDLRRIKAERRFPHGIIWIADIICGSIDKKRDPKSYRPDMALKTFKKADYRKALRRIVPLAPMLAANTILDRAQSPHMSRLPPGIAVWQATVSHIRHAETDYEALLSDGYDRDAARYFVLDDMNGILEQWGSSQFLSAEDDVS